MKISLSTKKTEETNKTAKFSCEFCKREFVRESTVLKHICEYKHRWLEKDRQGNRIGYQAFIQFYKKNSAAKKERTYEEFIKSAYYIAFVKFGSYCAEINAISVPRFLDWLVKNQIKIDTWTSDSVYTNFLIEFLRTEDSMDAIARSVKTILELADREHVQGKDYFRYGNKNNICYAVTTGKISPWILYHSESGKKFLDTLDETQIKMVIEYINPELWAIKFKRNPDQVTEVKKLLDTAGY